LGEKEQNGSSAPGGTTMRSAAQHPFFRKLHVIFILFDGGYIYISIFSAYNILGLKLFHSCKVIFHPKYIKLYCLFIILIL